MRSVILRALSTGRTEARVLIFRSFLFLVEKIRTFSTVAIASAARLRNHSHPSPLSDPQLTVPDVVPGSIWDISKSAVQTGADTGVEARNNALFQTLMSAFPCLTIRLRYKKTRFAQRGEMSLRGCVQKMANYTGMRRSMCLCTKWQLGVLVEFFKFKNYLDLLGSSGLALRTVHVYAIALRGLIGKSLNLPLSEVELSALGDVTYRALEKE